MATNESSTKPKTAASAVVPKPKTSLDTMAERLAIWREPLTQAARKGVDIDSFLNGVKTLLYLNWVDKKSTEKLADCEPGSVFNALRQALTLGVSLDPALQHAYLIRYGEACQIQMGYRGLMALAKRSGDATRFEATLVFAGDDFSWRRGTSPRIDHKPATDAQNDGGIANVTHVYAVVWHRDGTNQFDVMTKADVERIRAACTYNGPAWKSHPGEQYKKTVLKRLTKTLDLDQNRDLANALHLDNLSEGGREQILDMPEVVPRKTSTQDKLAAQLVFDPAEIASFATMPTAARETVPAVASREPVNTQTGEIMEHQADERPPMTEAEIAEEARIEAHMEQMEREESDRIEAQTQKNLAVVAGAKKRGQKQMEIDAPRDPRMGGM